MVEMKFEEALGRLEQIVRQLEEGSLGLDDSLKIFEEGIKLTHLCTQKLSLSEKKIQILMQNEYGEKSLHSFETDDQEPLSSIEESERKNEDNLS